MTTWKLVAVAAVAIFSGLLVWGLLVFGIARSAEDVCFDDLKELEDPRYGGYSQRGKLFPPTFECTLRSSDPSAPTVVVNHHVLAWGGVLTTALFPVVWLAATWVALRRLRTDRLNSASRR